MKIITKETINAIKKCDTICFRLERGVCTMELSKEPTDKEKKNNPFAQTVRVVVEVDSTLVDYNRDRKLSKEIANGFVYHSVYSFEQCKATLLGNILKDGYSVRACWFTGNSSVNDIENRIEQSGLNLQIFSKAGKNIGQLPWDKYTGNVGCGSHLVK